MRSVHQRTTKRFATAERLDPPAAPRRFRGLPPSATVIDLEHIPDRMMLTFPETRGQAMIFTREQFEAYESEFNNAKDKSTFFDRYYDPAAVFIHPYKGTFQGKEQLVSFWNAGDGSGHDGIHEFLHLTDFISTEDRLAVQLDIEWRCFKDTDYLGPRKKGDVFWGKCAAFYKISNGKFVRVQLYLNLADDPPARDRPD